ncbi:sensor histidine kinase [Alphaproteobacteria bacterium]|jgi:two-component system sensor histidine kinase TctE|nr:sensor histidine kinase [Alphaproteobacteria bacterium]
MRLASQNPMSLRWRLLLALVTVAVVISGLFLILIRQITEQAVQATQDALLETAVASILENTRSSDNNVEIDLPYDVFTMLGAISEDKIYYRVDLDGDLLTGYHEIAVPSLKPLGTTPYLSSAVLRDVSVRQATIQAQFFIDGKSHVISIAVAQSQMFQDDILSKISRNASIFGLVFLIVAIVMALLVTNSILRPINLLAEAVSRRGPHDLRDVKHPTPLEMMPLVLSLNGFIRRLRGTLRQTETFIAEAAHHIRTPLSLVKSESQLALRKSIDAESRNHLLNIIGAVDQSSRSASQLLDHALVLYRSEQNNTDRIDLVSVIKNVVDNFQPSADLRDITIVIEGDLKAPVFIMADRMLVEVALRNILDNAVKYSPPDKTVRIMLDQQKTMARICVIDQGRGIKGVNIKGQHKRFKRGSNVDDVVGSGLGLAIINEICATFGGKFNLKNNRSGGACAIIQLPLC